MNSDGKSLEVRKGRNREIELKVDFMVKIPSTHRDPARRFYRYYFQVPRRYLAQGCDVPSMPLGEDLDKANATAAIMYAGFKRWKLERDQVYVEKKVAFGTFDWLAGKFLETEHFLSRTPATRNCYASDLRTFSDVVFKEGKLAGSRLGDVKLGDLTKMRVSNLIDELHVLKHVEVNGTRRVVRCGGRVRDQVSTACTMWNHMAVKIELAALQTNPFAGHRIEQHTGTNAAATYEETQAVLAAADELGLAVVGTIALTCFEFKWRPKHVVDLLRVEHYRPPDRPDEILITDSKNNVSVWRPLVGEDGTELYPELMERLDALKGSRVQGLMFNQTHVHGDSPHAADTRLSMDWVRTQIRKVCAHAGVRNLTLTTYRHGGITEMAEARLTPHQIMSHTLHKDSRTLQRYIKLSATMQRDTQLTILDHRKEREMARTGKAERAATAPVQGPAHAVAPSGPAAPEVAAPRLTWGYGTSWNVKVT